MSIDLRRSRLGGGAALLVFVAGITTPAVADMPPLQFESRDVDGPVGTAP
jgi:hypothetical protein